MISQPLPAQEFTLFLVSTVSVGQASTYAVDRLVQRHNFTKVGYFHSQHQEPVCSVSSAGQILMPAELYLQGSVLVLQLRSLFRKGRADQFLKDLLWLIDQTKCNNLLFVSSCAVVQRPDKVIAGSPERLYYLHSEQGGANNFNFQGATGLEEVTRGEEGSHEQVSGLGLARLVVQGGPKLKGVQFSVVMMFSRMVEDEDCGARLGEELCLRVKL